MLYKHLVLIYIVIVLNKQLATAFFELINDMWIPERNICESKLAEVYS